jgi:hypothetical protein
LLHQQNTTISVSARVLDTASAASDDVSSLASLMDEVSELRATLSPELVAVTHSHPYAIDSSQWDFHGRRDIITNFS